MAFAILSDKKYDILDPMVEDIHNKCIKMNYEEERVLVQRFQRVIEIFIRKMREVDSFFRVVYNRIGYTGSYFDGLRVGEATEFDLNLILKPRLKAEIKGEKRRCLPGFISVVIEKKYENLPEPYKQWAKDIGNNRTVLEPDRVCNWLQGVVQRAINELQEEEWFDCEILGARKSGPAWTLILISHKCPKKVIEVDLVPVLEFSSTQWPIPRKSKRFMCGSFNETWFAVPKPPRGVNDSTDWRLSFPKQEIAIMKGLAYLKYTLRLLKRVRDQFDHKAVASYYIKTLFLWEVQNPDKGIWARNKGRLFIYMLNRLKIALEERNIPFFWEEHCNLIGHVNCNTLTNFQGRLRNFLKHIDSLIDSGQYEQLERFIRTELSTPEEVIEEQQSYCTIL